MKPQLDMDRIARGLRAQRRGKITAPGGYVGAIELLADIEARFGVPPGGGRPMPDGPSVGSSRSRRKRSSGWRRSQPRSASTGRDGGANATRSAAAREDNQGAERRRSGRSRSSEATRRLTMRTKGTMPIRIAPSARRRTILKLLAGPISGAGYLLDFDTELASVFERDSAARRLLGANGPHLFGLRRHRWLIVRSF
jgi:hypothetical protein